jgi:serine/threonine protein kinase
MKKKTRKKPAKKVDRVYAHSQNPPIIHRDISPSNILVDVLRSGSVAKISDFGLAKHLDAASLLAKAAGSISMWRRRVS